MWRGNRNVFTTFLYSLLLVVNNICSPKSSSVCKRLTCEESFINYICLFSSSPKWMMGESFPLWRKPPHNLETSQDGLEKRGFKTWCKLLIAFKNRNVRLDFERKHLRKASQVLESDLLDGGNRDKLVSEDKSLEKERNSRWSKAAHHVSNMVETGSWHGYVQLPTEAYCCLLMMWLLMGASGWIMRCIGLYLLLTFSQNM